MKDVQGIGRLAAMLIGLGLLAGLFSLLLLRGTPSVPSSPAATELGATFAPRGAGRHLVVDSLRQDGPARRAGLHTGDVVEAVNGHLPRSPEALDRAIGRRGPVILRIERNGSPMDIRVPRRRATRKQKQQQKREKPVRTLPTVANRSPAPTDAAPGG